MTSNVIYEAQLISSEFYKIFAGVYNDFRAAATEDYKFELEPLGYDDFINSVEKGLIKCIILLENKIPNKYLVIAGAIANFTDIKTTFTGIIDAFQEKQKEILAQNIQILVRR